LTGLLAQESGVIHEHGFLAADSAHDGGHARVIAVTNPDGLAFFKIDAFQVLDKGGDEMLAGLLAVADDIDAGVQLFLQRQTQGIPFAFDQLFSSCQNRSCFNVD